MGLKKFSVLAYIIIMIITIVVGIIIFNNVSNGNEQSQNEKVSAENKYMESKLVNLINTMNNIKDENNSIYISKIPAQSKNVASGNSTSSSKGESQGNSREEMGGKQQDSNGSSGFSGDSQEKSSNTSLNAEESNKGDSQFILRVSGVLTNNENINWDNVKNEIEELYLSIPTITIDLYNQNVNQEDILSFNKEIDNLAMVAKDEKKLETLFELSKLYDYLPKFMQEDNELNKTIIETKSNIFKAYSKLDTGNWDEISVDIQNAINLYTQLLTNPNIDVNKTDSINKSYIMLNELQNAARLQDVSIFLIKYKNLIEELNNI